MSLSLWFAVGGLVWLVAGFVASVKWFGPWLRESASDDPVICADMARDFHATARAKGWKR